MSSRIEQIIDEIDEYVESCKFSASFYYQDCRTEGRDHGASQRASSENSR